EGFGYLLASNVDERDWIEDHYFQNAVPIGTYIPKYNDLTSGLNKVNTLKEQVLLRIYEEKNITLDKLKEFFQKTYFWYGIKQSKTKNRQIPIDQLLMIKEITPINILKLHSDHHQVDEVKCIGLHKNGFWSIFCGIRYRCWDTMLVWV
ncbi:MAG: hypothetical protein ACTSQL_11450, partial [Promethearchaeota archaeon]